MTNWTLRRSLPLMSSTAAPPLRVGAIRPRARLVHRRDGTEAWPRRDRGGRHSLPRRDRRAEWREEVERLAREVLVDLGRRSGNHRPDITREALHALECHSWAGNIRIDTLLFIN